MLAMLFACATEPTSNAPPSVPAVVETDPAAADRVRAFQAEYEAWWREHGAGRAPAPQTLAALAPLAHAHAVGGELTRLGVVDGWSPDHPDHSVEYEPVRETEPLGPDRARVHTQRLDPAAPQATTGGWREYLLERSGREWKIARVTRMMTGPHDPDPEGWARPPAPEGDLAEAYGGATAQVPARMKRLFAGAADLGELAWPAGRLVVEDPGEWRYTHTPLTRGAPAGPARVYAAISRQGGGQRVAGLRVSWGGAATRWVLAGPLRVDSGRAAIVPEGLLLATAPRQRERMLVQEAFEVATATTLPLEQPGASWVVSPAGWGDGVYPVLWGLTAGDEVAELVVDFRIEER
jgi:hypothetical protein